jgi:GntR family transcriptional regulator
MASTSSPIRRLDPADPTALHEQAAAQIRRAIAEGQAAPGERLPPAGDLAAVLGVNRNTVLRALRLLREEGVVEFRRGRGITVTAAAPQAAALVTAARDLLAQARRNGYGREDLIRLIQTLPDP